MVAALVALLLVGTAFAGSWGVVGIKPRNYAPAPAIVKSVLTPGTPVERTVVKQVQGDKSKQEYMYGLYFAVAQKRNPKAAEKLLAHLSPRFARYSIPKEIVQENGASVVASSVQTSVPTAETVATG